MARLVLDKPAVIAAGMEPAFKLVKKCSDRVERGARRRVGVKTGFTRASIYNEMRTTTHTVTARVGSQSPATWVEHEGAAPHIIRPRGRHRALKFYWKKLGQTVILPSVSHPGRKGSKFLTGPLVIEGPRHGFRVELFPQGLSCKYVIGGNK